MDRLTILVGHLYKSVAPTKYLFKVQLAGRFMALVGVIHWPVESPLYPGCDVTGRTWFIGMLTLLWHGTCQKLKKSRVL